MTATAESVGIGVRRQGLYGALDYGGTSILWLNVTNYGPSSEFYARVKEVRGLGVPGEAFYVAWENVLDPLQPIARGDTQRVKLACAFADPPAFWFNLPRSASWTDGDSHGVGIAYEGPRLPHAVDCRVQIQDKETDTLCDYLVAIRLAPAGEVELVSVIDMPVSWPGGHA